MPADFLKNNNFNLSRIVTLLKCKDDEIENRQLDSNKRKNYKCFTVDRLARFKTPKKLKNWTAKKQANKSVLSK